MMTTQQQLISFPRIDLDELEKTLLAQREKLEGVGDIKSRSAAMLGDAIEKEVWLTGEHKRVQADRLRLEANIASLQAIAGEMKVVEDDIAVELNATNGIITLLKAAGVRT